MRKGKSITTFVLRTLVATLPVWLAVALYIATDPFNILRYDPTKTVAHHAVARNMGFVSITTFNRLNDHYHYNAFIFGSSMSQNYRAEHWGSLLPPDASVMHFDATMETVAGITDKLRYLRDRGADVKYALIIIEEEMLRRDPLDNDILHVRPPAITDDVTIAHFHTLFFNAYKTPLIMGYCLAPQRFHDDMERQLIIAVEPTTRYERYNEFRYNGHDSLIESRPDEFFTPQRLKAITSNADRLYTVEQSVMTSHRVEELKALRLTLDELGTDYRVIVPPRYHRQLISAADAATLAEILGHERVFDYCRDPLSDNPRAYYDSHAHLIAKYCNDLLTRVYSNTRLNL